MPNEYCMNLWTVMTEAAQEEGPFQWAARAHLAEWRTLPGRPSQAAEQGAAQSGGAQPVWMFACSEISKNWPHDLSSLMPKYKYPQILMTTKVGTQK